MKPKSVRVWDTESWREVFTRPTPQREPTGRLRFAYSPDSRQLVVTCGDDRVLLWSAATRRPEESTGAETAAWASAERVSQMGWASGG